MTINNARIEGPPIQDIEKVSALRSKYLSDNKAPDFRNSRLVGRLAAYEHNELILLPAYAAPDTSTATLRTTDQLELSRQESRTAVKFGQLAVDRTLYPLNELVAAKYSTPNLVARELAASRKLATAELRTFTHVGLTTTRDHNTVSLLSRYEHGVSSLDNTLWDQEASQQAHTRNLALASAALWLSTLHLAGFTHGDAQPKNIAYDNQNNPFFIDLETASQHGTDIVSHRLGARSDVADFLQFQLAAVSKKELDEHFIDPYMQTFSDNGDISIIDRNDIYESHQRPLRPIVHFTHSSSNKHE